MTFLYVIDVSSETEFFRSIYVSVELTFQIVVNEYSESEEEALQLMKAI